MSPTASSSEAFDAPPRLVAAVLVATFLLLCAACEAPRPARSCAIGGGVPPSWTAGPVVAPPTRASLLAKFADGQPPGPATWIVPDAAHGASAKGNLLTPTDGAVTLHGVAVTTRPGDGFRFVATVLVDYQPVEATWRFWDAERTVVQQTRRGRGVAFVTTERIVVFDVEVRGLDERSSHELSTYIELAPQAAADTSDADVRRWLAVSQRGDPLPTLACVDAVPTDLRAEEKLLRDRGLTAGLARVEGNDALVVHRPSTIRLTVEQADQRTQAVATLIDGVPTGPAQLVRVGDGAGEAAWRSHVRVDRVPEIGIVGAVWREPLEVGPDSLWSTNFAATNFVRGAMRSREDGPQQVD